MTFSDIRIQLMVNAINNIRNIYHPDYKGLSVNHWDDSFEVQRDYKVRNIIEQLEKEMNELVAKPEIPLGGDLRIPGVGC